MWGGEATPWRAILRRDRHFFGTNDRRWGLVVNASMENRFESFDGSFPAAVSAAGAGGLAA